MRACGYLIAVAAVFVLGLGGCATEPLRFRDQAVLTMEHVQGEGAPGLRPADFRSLLETLRQGDALLMAGEKEEAERFFQLTLFKGMLLEQEVAQEKVRQQEAERLAEEQQRAELERRAMAEAQRILQEKALAEEQKEAAEVVRRKVKPPREHIQVTSYTVRRGESLPLISSQPEVYGDRNLWPLIYRANRDQIRDPRHIWPGQVLRIPRNTGRDEIGEARRYAQERPLH